MGTGTANRDIIGKIAGKYVLSRIGPEMTAAQKSAQVNVSGEWKIDAQNGAKPLCRFVQTGDDLVGTCTGPQAAGKIVGTVSGKIVKWQWQWVTYANPSSGTWEFRGTAGEGNSITGTIQQADRSTTFRAMKQ
jgi:hypothetical protein